MHIRYFIGYVYHICLQDTIQSTLSLCLRCQAMLLPMPLRPLLLTTRSGFNGFQIDRVSRLYISQTGRTCTSSRDLLPKGSYAQPSYIYPHIYITTPISPFYTCTPQSFQAAGRTTPTSSWAAARTSGAEDRHTPHIIPGSKKDHPRIIPGSRKEHRHIILSSGKDIRR